MRVEAPVRATRPLTAGDIRALLALLVAVLVCWPWCRDAGAAAVDSRTRVLPPVVRLLDQATSLSSTEAMSRLSELPVLDGEKGLRPSGSVLGGVIVVALDEDFHSEVGPSRTELALLAEEIGLESYAPCFPGAQGTVLASIMLVFLRDGDPAAAARQWSTAPGVRFAETYPVHHLALVPDDPRVDSQLHLEPVGAFAAWDRVRGETHPVTVAVVDGGIDVGHIDLASNVLLNPADPPDGIDGDGNGFVDDHSGWNFATGTGQPGALVDVTPGSVDHGTHVAGILSAISDNGDDVAGITWNDPVLCVAVGHPTVDQTVIYGYQGIHYAVSRGVKLINCSWGRSGRSSLLEMAVLEYAASLGAVVIAAAGNEATDTPFYPAAYPGVFAVANVTADGTRNLSSNHGDWVDIAAPGTFILSTVSGDRLAHKSGTSMAAPVVSGCAALLWGDQPGLEPRSLLQRLRLTARPLEEQLGDYADSVGAGMVQADAALAHVGPGYRIESIEIDDEDGDGLIEPGETVVLRPNWRNLLDDGSAPVLVRLTSVEREATVLSGSAMLGPLAGGSAGTASESFRVEISPFTAAGSQVSLGWLVIDGSAQGGYRDRFFTTLQVSPLHSDLDSGEIRATIAANGRIGFQGVGGGDGRDGIGVRYVPAGAQSGDGPLGNLLFEGALMIGTGPERVSNGARRTAAGEFDEHFVPPNSELTPRLAPRVGLANGQILDRAVAVFRDNLAPERLSVQVRWDLLTPPAGEGPGAALLLATVWNVGGRVLEGLRYGYFLDWDLNAGDFFPTFAANSTFGDGSGDFAVASRADGQGVIVTTALVPAGSEAAHFRGVDNRGSAEEWGIYDGFSMEEKWDALSDADGPQSALETDISQIWAAGPVDLAPGDSLRFVLVMAAGDDEDLARSNVLQGRDLARRILVQGRLAPPALPFRVGAPHPNPWNGAVHLDVEGNPLVPWRLLVYDLRGRRLHESLRELPGSEGILSWDGRDDRGRPVASGIYLLRAGQGRSGVTRKVLLAR